MTISTVQTTNMRPGALSDCELSECVPTNGGLCAFVANTPMWWCCQPYDASCWSAPKLCNYTETDQLVSQILCKAPAPGSSWCCDSMFESCPSNLTVQRCAPLDFPNPALDGPLWGPPVETKYSHVMATIISSMPGSLTTTRQSNRITVIGAGGAVATALVGCGGYLLWRRLRGKAECAPLPEPIQEVCGETRPTRELDGDKEPQELDSVTRYELCGGEGRADNVQ